jgi:DNA-binding protein H-NS
MPEWEYRKIALNLHGPRGDELELLNAAGADGWELVGISSNNIAYLKRKFEEAAPTQAVYARTPHANASDVRRADVNVKYRDSATNETWSGRGRMPNWLKQKKEAGEDIEEYLV